MRRVLPWALLSVVGLAAAGAAAVGAAETPSPTPAQWVAGVLATTAQAGSARFHYVHVTSSPNPDLHAALSGSGVVDFANGDVRVTEVDHQVEFEGEGSGPIRAVPTTTTEEAVAIGRVTYQRTFLPGGAGGEFIELPTLARPPQPAPALTLALNAGVAIGALEGPEPVVAVRDLGPARIGRIATTEYEVQTAPLVPCPSAHQTAPVSTQAPSLVWLDAHGRLVQVRSREWFSGRLPAGVRRQAPFAHIAIGPSTTTDTLTFSDFGTPVHITAPPASALAPSLGSSTGFAVSRPCTASSP